MTKTTNIAAGALAISFLMLSGAAHAQITGSIDATIELESGCIINGDENSDGAGNVDFGTLDFGTETTLFTEATAQVIGTATGIVIQCTAGTAPLLTFLAGQHDGEGTGAGNKAMQHGSDATQFVTYNLLRADNTTVIDDGDTVTLLDDGSEQTVIVNGRAFGAPGLIAGTYADTVAVTLEF